MAVLAAFPDRVARRRRGADLQLANGSPAQLAENSTVDRADLLVALDLERRPDRGAPLVRLASGIEPEWLLELFPERVRDVSKVEWNRQAERVEAYSALVYDDLPFEENRGGMPEPGQAAAMLAEQAWSAGIERFVDAEEWAALRARLDFAAAQGLLPEVSEADLRAALESLSAWLRSFAELREALRGGAWVAAVLGRLGPGAARVLDETAPARLRLPGGRLAKVGYAAGQPPWVSSRLQDFFGMAETPRVARGKVAVVVHLLAPNQRPVQMTQDLAGFWERLYPQIRRELMRRYPRHAWPENPYTPEKR
jgi:ATP-dependent helicase HrpB